MLDTPPQTFKDLKSFPLYDLSKMFIVFIENKRLCFVFPSHLNRRHFLPFQKNSFGFRCVQWNNPYSPSTELSDHTWICYPILQNILSFSSHPGFQSTQINFSQLSNHLISYIIIIKAFCEGTITSKACYFGPKFQLHIPCPCH